MNALKVNNRNGGPGDPASVFDRIGFDRSVILSEDEVRWDGVGRGREGNDTDAAAGPSTRKQSELLPSKELLRERSDCTVSAMVRGDRILPRDGQCRPQKKACDGSDLIVLIESMWRCVLSGDSDIDTKLMVANEERSRDSERERTVRFSGVDIREYGLTASHNPGGRAGVPLELSWEYNALGRTPVDVFEDARSWERAANFREEGRLTRSEREGILLAFGATTGEIREASRRAALARGRRRRSVCTMQHDGIYEEAEKGLDALRGAFGALRRRARRLQRGGKRYGVPSEQVLI